MFSAFGQFDYMQRAKICVSFALGMGFMTKQYANTKYILICWSVGKVSMFFWIVSGNPTNEILPLMLFPHKGNSHTKENPPRIYFPNEWNSPTNVNPRM